MIWDKIWKRKDKPDDSNDCSLKGSYLVCTGTSNSPSYTYVYANGECISCNGGHSEGHYALTKQEYIEHYSAFDIFTPLHHLNKSPIIVLNDFISYLSIKYPLKIATNIDPITEEVFFIMSTSFNQKVGFKTDLFASLYHIGLLIIDTYEKGVETNPYIADEQMKRNEDSKSDNPQAHYCTSCGAALKRNSHKCEYCDTEYW